MPQKFTKVFKSVDNETDNSETPANDTSNYIKDTEHCITIKDTGPRNNAVNNSKPRNDVKDTEPRTNIGDTEPRSKAISNPKPRNNIKDTKHKNNIQDTKPKNNVKDTFLDKAVEIDRCHMCQSCSTQFHFGGCHTCEVKILFCRY